MTFTQEQVEKITDEALEIARIQALAYKQGYQKGFEDGKKQATEALVKIYQEEESVLPEEI